MFVKSRLLGSIWFGIILFGFAITADIRSGHAAEKNVTAVAESIIKHAGIDRGICVVLGAADADFPISLVQESRFLVYVREPNATAVARLQKEADEYGLGNTRLAIEHGSTTTVPFATGTVDVIVMPGAPGPKGGTRSADKPPVSWGEAIKEITRALRPEGVALLAFSKGVLINDEFVAEVKKIGIKSVGQFELGNLNWVRLQKQRLEGAGDWSHWEHGPDNNPVSTDTVIKAPYMTQFMAKPFYIGMPSITTAAAGRTFLAIGHIAHHRREWELLNKLIARNGYNGTVIWQRDLPEGYLVHRSAFIATRDAFFMINGDHALLIDPQTGVDIGKIRIPGLKGQWKWMVKQDDVLYVLAGTKQPGAEITKGDRAFGGWSWADLSRGYYGKNIEWGFGTTLTAYHLKSKKVLWLHSEKTPIDARSMSLGGGKLSVYCPQKYFKCLDAKTGKKLWENTEKDVLDLIEEPGVKLRSTPGFRTACLTVFTPDAYIIQGQTRNKVIALSTRDGYLLWKKQKVTNNPNAIYVDGKVILGVGKNGNHVALEPTTGNVLEDLLFKKTACTRLTACSDSFFVRGEGTLRYDRKTKKVLIDGAQRPACNDGAMPANGLLYLGPWQCDCNLSLIGNIAKCSAGDFRFDHVATNEGRLVQSVDLDKIADFTTSDADWSTFRGDVTRSGSGKVAVAKTVARKWQFTPDAKSIPSAPVSAGGLLFVAGNDGKLRAIDSATGRLKWQYATPGEIKLPPTIWNGRAYFGGGDGHAYALEAATGRLLWKFRAAPVERHIFIYGSISSTWPVQSGVMIKDGTAYFAAGIIDHDGTYLYAVDAKSGKLKWQNNSSGHMNAELRKGVSVQGNLTVSGNRLLLAGGNQLSPAPFDLESGKLLVANLPGNGRPRANNGQFIGVFRDKHAIVGGRIMYSAPGNVATKGSFVAVTEGKARALNWGGIAPVWDDDVVAFVNFRNGKLTCCDADKVEERMVKGLTGISPRARRASLAQFFQSDGAIRWQSNLGESNKFEAISLAACSNAIVAVVQFQQRYRSQPQRYVVAFDKKSGKPMWRHEIRQEPLPGGLLIDRDGQVIVTMMNGSVVCVGPAT